MSTEEQATYQRMTKLNRNQTKTLGAQNPLRAKPPLADSHKSQELPNLWGKALEVSAMIILFPLLLAGCASDEVGGQKDEDQNDNQGCIPGESEACVCPSGKSGAQVCQPNRTFGVCECEGEKSRNKCQDVNCGPGYVCREGECIADCISEEMICGETRSGVPATLECSTTMGKAEWIANNGEGRVDCQ